VSSLSAPTGQPLSRQSATAGCIGRIRQYDSRCCRRPRRIDRLSADETMLVIRAFSCFPHLASIAEDPIALQPDFDSW